MPTLAEKLSFTSPKNVDENPPEITDEIPEDPAPGQSRRRVVNKPKPSAKPAPRKPNPLPSKAAVRDELEGYLQMAALTWSMRCDQCGGALSDQSEVIADRLAAIIVRTPRLLQLFAHGSGIGEYLLLGQALVPVVRVGADHRNHAAPEVSDGHEANLSHFAPFRPATA